MKIRNINNDRRCDHRVRKAIGDQRVPEYMETILNSVKKAEESKYVYSPLSSVSLYTKNTRFLLERFSILTDVEKTGMRERIFLVGIAVLFVFSYLMLPLPQYVPPQNEIEENGAEEVTADASYIVFDGKNYMVVTDSDNVIEISKEGALLMIENGFRVRGNE